MNFIHDIYYNFWIIILINSICVFIDNQKKMLQINKKEFDELDYVERSVTSSSLFSAINSIIDLFMLLFFWKEKILQTVLIIFFWVILLLLFRKWLNKLFFFEINQLIFDIITILKPFLMYSTIYYW